MKKKYLFVLVLLMLITFSYSLGEEVFNLSLKDCINMALETHPDMNKANQTIIIAESQKTQALSGFYPEVGISGNYYRTNQGNTTIGGSVFTPTNSKQSHNLTLGVNQRIFDSFRTWKKYQYSKYQIEKTEYSLEKEIADLSMEVTEAYFENIKQKYLVKLYEIFLEQSIRNLDIASANYEAGISPEADTFSADVKVTEAKVTLLEGETNLKNNSAYLKSLIGLEDKDVELEEELYILKDTPLLRDAINKAFIDRPELKEIGAQLESQEEQIDLINMDRYPQLTIDIGYYSNITKDPSFPENYYSLVAQISFPIFDGFSTEAKIEEAEANKNIYEAEKENLRKTIRLEVESSYYNLEMTGMKIELTEQQVEEAEKNLNISTGRYEAGVAPFQEVLDSQVTFNQAMTGLIRARYDYQIALFSFKKATGEEFSL